MTSGPVRSAGAGPALSGWHLARLKDGAGVHPAQISFGKLNNVRETTEMHTLAPGQALTGHAAFR